MPPPQRQITHERLRLLRQLTTALEMPMMVLGIVWLVLLVIELIEGPSAMREMFGTVIWAAFVVEFGLKLLVSPHKLSYLRHNWLIALSLMLPALRVFRVLRAMRAVSAARTFQVARGLAGFNNGLRALRRALQRRRLGYVLALTAVIALIGSAGVQYFEQTDTRPGGFQTYASSLWFTLMLLTSVGSEYWPRSDGGRVLCLLLSVYGFAVFGYITAALASFFVDRDSDAKEHDETAVALRDLHAEVARLRQQLLSSPPPPSPRANPPPPSSP